MTALAAAPAAKAAPAPGTPEVYELRTITLRIGQQKVVHDFLAEAALPALQKLGAGPVGVFEVVFGPVIPTVVMLIPYRSAAQMAEAHARLPTQAVYHQGPAAQAYHRATATQPPYVRIDSALLQAMTNLPRLVLPTATAEKKARIFELRTYEAPNEAASAKKREMFTRMGETEIFRRVGLTPVFFGHALIGPRLPNFTYMLTFPDLAAREQAWATFRADAEWTKLKSTPGYSDAEIMSNITDLILKPTAYSQI